MPSAVTPKGTDLTADNITENVLLINSKNPNARFKYVLETLVLYLHKFARDVRLSTNEWRAGLAFLVATGQKCTDLRHEFILLSDILGLSLLVDSIDHPKPSNSTEGTLLGPFHTHDAQEVKQGTQISQDERGEPLLAVCTVKDVNGKPIEGVVVDIWETDSAGFYDVQYEGRTGPAGRALLRSNADGGFWFMSIVPVPYPIPGDGPVGQLLKLLQRHNMRPAHMHFKFEKEGYDQLITALYLRGDPYETSDAVFGVKSSLLVDLGVATPEEETKYGVRPGTKTLHYDFVLVTDEETLRLREENSRLALEKSGRRGRIVEGLPVPELD